MSIERTVAVLTPLFAAGAGWLTALIATAVPGVNIPAGDFTALFIAGATVAASAALKWLHGRQKVVALTDEAKTQVEDALRTVRAEIAASPQASLAIGDIENLLKQHTGDIERAIDARVPAVVGQSIGALFSQLGKPVVSDPAPVAPPAPAA